MISFCINNCFGLNNNAEQLKLRILDTDQTSQDVAKIVKKCWYCGPTASLNDKDQKTMAKHGLIFYFSTEEYNGDSNYHSILVIYTTKCDKHKQVFK